MASASEIIASRYELLSVLGRGGMGVVYRGRDRVLDRIVAVKVLPAAYAADAILVQRFEREARAAARLNHPNIVAVFDTGRDATVRYIVMECVAGESLAQRLEESGALSAPDAVEIAAQIAEALGAAHAAGIIHRDVKPANVMVQPSGVCKVLDFGIARAAAEAVMTQTASMLGSAPYMAPETALGEVADARSDIYSLGCVLYQMLTGRLPFYGDLPAAVIHQHVNAQPRRPSEFAPTLPAALDALVMQMLAKDPGDRPQDASTAAAALRASLQVTTFVTPALPPRAEASPRRVADVPPPPVADVPPPRIAEAPASPRRGRFPAGLLGIAAVVALLVGIGIALAASPGSTTHTTSSGTSSTAAASTRSQSTPAHSQTSSTSRTSSVSPSTLTSTTTVTSSPSTSSTATSSTRTTSGSSSSSSSTTPGP